MSTSIQPELDQMPEPTGPEPQEDMPTPQGNWKALLGELLQTILLAALLYFGINAITTRIHVQSISMQPTLYEKDLVLVNKLAYRFGEPQRGDVIVFRPPVDPDGEPYIKRLIGLPGDQVHIADGLVVVNGQPLHETYLNAAPSYQGDWNVPQGYIFVLGDNRNNSSDSHQWGLVSVESILGRAEFVYFPIAHWKFLHANTAAAAGP
ncbi:MAG: signal peptidase I [Chloroflexota bacterium]